MATVMTNLKISQDKVQLTAVILLLLQFISVEMFDAIDQLTLLKSNKLVKQRRDGKMIFYTLVDEHVKMVVEKGAEHMSRTSTSERLCAASTTEYNHK